MKYLVFAIFFITTVIGSYPTFISNIAPVKAAVSHGQLDILFFLENYGGYDDTIVEIPNVPSFEKEDVESWFWRDSNVIMAALGRKRMYLANEVIIHPYEERHGRYNIYWSYEEARDGCDNVGFRQDVCEISMGRFVALLQTENIKLLYVPTGVVMPKHSKLNLLTQNGAATIYEVLPL